jgi:hypothetical protein
MLCTIRLKQRLTDEEEEGEGRRGGGSQSILAHT